MCIYCENCGLNNLQESKICSGCGSSLTTAIKEASRQKKFFAVFLNAIYPGTGYFYAGNVKKALWFMPLYTFTFYVGLFVSYFIPTSVSYLISYGASATLFVYGLVDVYRYLNQAKHETIKWYFVLLFLATSIIFYFIVHNMSPVKLFSQPSVSMENTIKKGDKFIVLLKNYVPNRSDVVVFRNPINQQINYIKRCVALPGDELIVLNKILYLHPREGNDYAEKAFSGYEFFNFDGKIWVKDPYKKEHSGIHNDDRIVQDGMTPMEIFDFGPVQVPERQYFMMGDNRDHSNDSRFFGAVSYENIEGKVTHIFVNWNELDRAGKMIE